MLNTSTSIKSISMALLAFQGRVDGVARDSANPHFKNRYASLEAVHHTAVPVLQDVGIVYIQIPGAIVDGVMAMTTRLIHAETGEWIEGTGDIPLGKRDPQGAGSAQTYAQRYHLMAMLGLPPIDDDGEGAIDRENKRPEPQTLPKAKARDLEQEMRDELNACLTLDDLDGLVRSPAWKTEVAKLPKDWQDLLRDAYTERRDELMPKSAGKVAPNFDKLEKA